MNDQRTCTHENDEFDLELNTLVCRDCGLQAHTLDDDSIAHEERRIPCRCGVDVRECVKGCTLYECCGGYVSEGHMSDCDHPAHYVVHGIHH